MALTITPTNYYQYGNCDALADLEGTWTGGSAGTESDFYKEGAGCLGFTLRTVGQNDITYTKTSGTWDLSSVRHLRLWFLCSTPNAVNIDDPADPANAGIQFFVGDATNTAYYKVSGKTSYPGGWYNLVIDLSRAADSGTKPTGMLCTKIGLRLNMTVAPKNVDNVWIDNLIRCDGLGCTSDTQFGLQEIYDKDNATTGGWGVVRKIAGVYYLAGSLVFGDATGAGSCDFKDISQAVIFEDRKVNTALYELKAVNNTGTCKAQLGDKVGTAGVSGCVVRTQSLAQTPKYAVTCTDVDVSDFKLYGTTFLDAGITSLPPNGVNREVLNCSFEKCGKMIASTCVVKNCNFISSDGAAALINNDPHYVTNCNFISCNQGVEINMVGDGTYDFNALIFSDTGWPHVNNTSGSTLTVANGSGANASTYTGSLVNFTGSVTLTMTVKNSAGTPIVAAYAYIDNNDIEPYIMNTTTDGYGVATTGYTGAPVTGARWRVRKYGYKDFKQLIDIASSDISLPITLVADPQQY